MVSHLLTCVKRNRPAVRLSHSWRYSFSDNPFLVAYFVKSSPDFINGRGQVIHAAKQVDALAQAQSIGVLRPSSEIPHTK